MEQHEIYTDMATRTGGNIYIGVVGPVRTGKSTFIKRFMETLVIPKIENIYQKERAKDELPPKRLRPHHYDRRTQVCAGRGGGD